MASDYQATGSISHINVTPFVDVMLVLLVIFMVTAPILQQGVNVELPAVEAGPLVSDTDAEQLIVAIDRQGRLHLNDTQVDAAGLAEKLTAIVKLRPDRPVYLRADKDVVYGTVVEVMAAIRSAGIVKLGMVTEPLPPNTAGNPLPRVPANIPENTSGRVSTLTPVEETAPPDGHEKEYWTG